MKKAIKNIFNQSRETYGYRRIHCELVKLGFHYCQETIRKLMTQLGLKVTIYSKHSQTSYHSYRGKVGRTAPNLLAQTFNETEPYRVLHTDISQIKLAGVKIRGYISPVLDEASDQIIACAVSGHPDKLLVRKTLQELFSKLPKGSQSILHSDQGWHYQMPFYQHQLKKHHIVQSMSRKGNCLDNSPIESFFNLLKRECLNRLVITSIEQLQKVVRDYIEWFNSKRISLNKNGMTPNEYVQYHSTH